MSTTWNSKNPSQLSSLPIDDESKLVERGEKRKGVIERERGEEKEKERAREPYARRRGIIPLVSFSPFHPSRAHAHAEMTSAPE